LAIGNSEAKNLPGRQEIDLVLKIGNGGIYSRSGRGAAERFD
jgi:hypothetical protein